MPRDYDSPENFKKPEHPISPVLEQRPGIIGQIRQGWEDGDLQTVPNFISLAKIGMAGVVGAGLASRRISPKTAFMASTLNMSLDLVDGKLARLGDRHLELQKYGFSTSETGAKLDAMGDKFTFTFLLAGGIKGNYLSKSNLAMLPLEAATSALVYRADREGKDLGVVPDGKKAVALRFATLGLDFLAKSAQEKHPKASRVAHAAGLLSVVGSQWYGLKAYQSYKKRAIEQS